MANYVRFRLSPEVVISIGARVKQPGDDMDGEAVELVARHSTAGVRGPYDRLLGDANVDELARADLTDLVEKRISVVA